MRRLLLVSSLLLFTCLAGYGQTDPSCKQLMDAYVKKIRAYRSPTENQYVLLHMNIMSVPVQNNVLVHTSSSPQQVELKVVTGQNKLFYESTYLAIYQDEQDIYTVIHPQKTIIHSKPEKTSTTENQAAIAGHFSTLQQRLLERCEVQACRDTVYSGQRARIITLQPHKEDQEQYHIGQIVNYLIPSKATIVKQIISFTDGYPLQKQIVVYHTVDLDYRGKRPASARSNVLNASGKLLPNYRGYRLEEE